MPRFITFVYNFNPRSLTGATGELDVIAKRNVQFQSTLPRGSDVYHHARRVHTISISIHAPSRERRRLIAVRTVKAYFNPRSLAGATIYIFKSIISSTFYFNPRSLAGATDVASVHQNLLHHFNPRSLAGAT